MKILQLTDIHDEYDNFDRFYSWREINKIYPDVLILSGDITCYSKMEKFLRSAAKNAEQVILVKGNHECYGHNLLTVAKDFKEMVKDLENVHILERESVIINDVRFIGATLWTDLGNNPLMEARIACSLNDFYHIDENDDKLTINTWLSEHRKDLAFLYDELFNKEYGGETVVITHHSPTMEGALKDGSIYTPNINGYGSDLRDVVENSNAKYWFYGHTHYNYNEKIGNTILINNFGKDALKNTYEIESKIKKNKKLKP